MPVPFVDDELGYKRWIAAHPGGYVVNTYRTPGPTYLKLHRATCRTISGSPARGIRWTSGGYAKVCADDRAELDRWARTAVGGTLDPCPFCQP